MDAIDQLSAGLAGRYSVEREIGAGGMATVFLARDLRHDRRVALKVLKPELGAVLGAERFLSEIRVTANLQHPNLLPLFDSGTSDGLLYYVMPYVDGESLRQRLDREKQLPVDEAVRLAIAICGALDYAHRHGVIHRDLKPENVLLHDGQPLIADFGIALAISNAGGARATQTGLALGTPQYMSPEQATGDRTIDARSDIYSVGALTYEMLAGEAPHTGTSAQAIIAKLMTEEPRPLSVLRRSVPAHVDAAVHRALEKLRADRFASAHDLADALSGKAPVERPSQNAHVRSLKGWRFATLGLAAVAAVAVAWAATHDRRSVATQPLRFPLGLPDSVALNAPTFGRSLDLSPNGALFAYVGANGLFIRPLNDLRPRRLTSERATDPRFSPNGAWVAYVSNGTLRRVRVTGGAPETIVDSVARFGWSSKGAIVFTRSGPRRADLWQVSENGGVAKRLVHQRRSTDVGYGTPSFLPDGDTFLVPVVSAPNDSAELVAYRMSDGDIRYLGVHGNNPRYLSGGVLLYGSRDGGIEAISFDARARRVTGTATRVFDDAKGKPLSVDWAVSSTGTLAYLPGIAVPYQLIEVDRAGRVRVLPLAPDIFSRPRYSPEGRRVAMEVHQTASVDIFVYDIGSSTMRQVTTSHGEAGSATWTPDGRRIGWTEVESGLGLNAVELRKAGTFWGAADGSDSPTILVPDGLGLSFAPSGNFAVTVVRNVKSGRSSVYTMRLDSTRRMTLIAPETHGPLAGRVSPDGRWLAYTSLESGRTDIYIRPLPGPGGFIPISVGGGTEPVWNPRGRELFYRAGSRLIAATLALEPDPRVVRRDTLPFEVTSPASGIAASFDVSPDGTRFLMVKAAGRNDQPVVITGWLDEVRRLLEAANR